MPLREEAPERTLELPPLQELARAHGIASHLVLAEVTGLGKQVTYRRWNGMQRHFTVEGYAALLLGLAPAGGLPLEPGDWFRWNFRAGKPAWRLAWQVREQAEACGLTLAQLMYKTEVHYRTLTPYWDGSGTGFYYDTLARLAIGLERVSGKPFAIGDLLKWREA